eukprot:TRINITY_DN13533_c0_g1_i2.p1 TRINITY_DN13533_c0_g1~~TRINITY_DN13533_c0_g1_i2.p1  ORF type:complete len:123 (+),score=20.03 TRINITY_DN13533_c0_g1_i2:25-393(+)
MLSATSTAMFLLQDEEMSCYFAVVSEGNIVGVRVHTAHPTMQSNGIRVGVGSDLTVQAVPSPQARAAVIRTAEDFTVPQCAEGTELDFHFSSPIKGNIVRVELQNIEAATYAQHVSVLVEGE